jgi:tetratricopeptide (TPR) repeat protein
MNTISLHTLDQQELQQLASAASAAGDQASALVYMKEAAGRPEASAVTHYLLGLEYAELRMYERAIDQIGAALALDPALVIARFQLGLLWLSSGNGARAIEVLQVLAELGDDNYLARFGVGLCHMARDEFEPALAALRAGLELNRDNAPLNGDMQRMVEGILAVQASNAEEAAKEQDANHMFLSAYTGNTSQ